MIQVNDVYLTVQGEGVHTGVPMVLVRLQGCGVGCPWCDTKETWKSEPADQVATLEALSLSPNAWMSVDEGELAQAVREIAQGAEWVLLTGGEPGEQDLDHLIACFHQAGFKVAVETSGTVDGVLDVGIDWLCCSPKFGMAGGRDVLPAVLEQADEIKMVVGNFSHIETLRRAIDGLNRKGIVCLQPLSTLPKATTLCVTTCQEMGWRLSLQTHKWAGVR